MVASQPSISPAMASAARGNGPMPSRAAASRRWTVSARAAARATPWRAMVSSSAVNQCGSRLPSASRRERWRSAFS